MVNCLRMATLKQCSTKWSAELVLMPMPIQPTKFINHRAHLFQDALEIASVNNCTLIWVNRTVRRALRTRNKNWTINNRAVSHFQEGTQIFSIFHNLCQNLMPRSSATFFFFFFLSLLDNGWLAWEAAAARWTLDSAAFNFNCFFFNFWTTGTATDTTPNAEAPKKKQNVLSLVNARRLNCTADTSMSVVNPHFLGNIDENMLWLKMKRQQFPVKRVQ